jgi:hypothetical protein
MPLILPGVDSYMLVAAAVFDVKSMAEFRLVGEAEARPLVVRDTDLCADIMNFLTAVRSNCSTLRVKICMSIVYS